MLKALLRRKPKLAPIDTACLPEGLRVYAIGDIHGRRDLLDMLLDQIESDDRMRGPADTQIVFLGDLVDRGPDSSGVIDRAMELADARGERASAKRAGKGGRGGRPQVCVRAGVSAKYTLPTRPHT